MLRNTASPALIVVSAGAIAERAYQMYVERGRADGFDRDDWLRAERELNATQPRPGEASASKVKPTMKRM